MTSLSTDDAEDSVRARPYGLVGLVVSSVGILVLTSLILACLAMAVVAALVARFGWQGFLAQFQAWAESASDGSAAAKEAVGIFGGAVGYAALVAAVLLMARLRAGAGWRDLIGWHRWRGRGNRRVFALMMVATLCWSVMASLAIERIYPASKDWITTPTGTPLLIGFVALAVVFAPIAEETFFRGWIYTSLRRSFGVPWAVGLSAALFAIAHWEATHLYALAVFPVGLALGVIRERADSLRASMTFHAIYNAVALLLLLVGK